jgi:drug/metabolite transporter (DMT)-like permease
MTEPEKPAVTELGLLGVLALLWGSSYYFAKIALMDLPPMTLAASRVAIAAAFLLIVMRIVGDKLPKDGRTWRMLFVQACFNSILSWSILAWGQQHIDVALASVLNSTSPIFVFFITLALVRKAPPGRSLWGACVGLGGVALIVGGDLADGVDASLAGCAAALIGAFLYGCAAVYGKRITGPSPLATATGTMLWATLALVPVAALVDAPWRLQPGAEALYAATIQGVFCTGAALVLFFRLQRTLGSMGVASQAYLRAGVGALLGILLLGEQPTWTIGAGVVLAILGVALINSGGKSKEKASSKTI